MDFLEKHGIGVDDLRGEIANGLDRSKQIYFQRLAGVTNDWSATTRCKKCLKFWMWGVKDNLDFTCEDCK